MSVPSRGLRIEGQIYHQKMSFEATFSCLQTTNMFFDHFLNPKAKTLNEFLDRFLIVSLFSRRWIAKNEQGGVII